MPLLCTTRISSNRDAKYPHHKRKLVLLQRGAKKHQNQPQNQPLGRRPYRSLCCRLLREKESNYNSHVHIYICLLLNNIYMQLLCTTRISPNRDTKYPHPKRKLVLLLRGATNIRINIKINPRVVASIVHVVAGAGLCVKRNGTAI